MSDCLVILHVRNNTKVLAAFNELPVDRLWLTGWTEAQLADGVFSEALREFPYDRYFVCADDILVRPAALAAVQAALDQHPVVTGFSQRSHTDLTVNVTRGPLRDTRPTVEAYDFCQLADVLSHTAPLIRSWFAGMSITGMDRAMWEEFPFGCFTDGDPKKGYASDFHLSRRLQDADIPIYAVRDAFAYHWRHEWQHTNHPLDDRLFLGERPPEVYLHRGRRA